MSHAQLDRSGVLAWFAGNPVAANLLMLVCLVGGFLMLSNVRQEVFPEAVPEIVTIQVPYPGASPEEVEQGVLLAIEQAVQGIDGVKRVTATANESIGTVSVELITSTDGNIATADIKNAVDRIVSFPEDAEQPVVSLLAFREETISLILYGDVSEDALRHWGYSVRDDLLQDRRVTDVEVTEVRPLEVSIEVPEDELRRHNLSLPQVANVVRDASVELPGGGLRTEGGEVLVRTTERRDRGSEFEEIVVVAQPGGTQVALGDIATVIDGYQETDEAATYNGMPAVRVRVFRKGDQTPIDLSDAVREYVEGNADRLPEGVGIAIWNDTSEVFRDRIQLLLKNAYFGLLLVLVLLAIFLEVKLAFWVTLGIPVSFLGAVVLMPSFDVSFNMISLFAFILTLGIVVDDAIVVGESIYEKRQRGLKGLDAAIAGVREVARPVTFSIVTTLIAFIPMLFIPGVSGKFMRNVPLIVIAVLIFSLVESFFILPAHLAHDSGRRSGGLLGAVQRAQSAFSRAFDRLVETLYPRVVKPLLEVRYLTMALGFGVLLLTAGVVGSGMVRFSFLPRIESDNISCDLRMPYGTPIETTEAYTTALVDAARNVLDEHGGFENVSEGIYASIGTGSAGGIGGSHLTSVNIELVPIDDRPITTGEFAQLWRERVGEIPGAELLTFSFSTGPGAGAPIEIRLSHQDVETLEASALALAEQLATYTGVVDIDSGVSPGKEQLDFTLTPEARTLGISERDLANQLRAAYFGAEAVRQQRGRDELRVYVRRPDEERRSEYFLETMLIRTPTGGEIPLNRAADIERSRAYTSITRVDMRRVISVTADVDSTLITANEVVLDLEENYRTQFVSRTPGLRWESAGEQEDQNETMEALSRGMLMAMFAMYALMAVAFRSYVQPIIIMIAIPFGLVGAIAGHVIMGYNLSLLSMFGIVALAGVVVNDTLLLVTAINTNREEGLSPFDAAIAAGTRRFRPILMTSLSTFLGLMPMLLETSVQARFLIPMAISLAFGVLLVTVIALVICPALYLILEDILGVVRRLSRWLRGPAELDRVPEAAE